MNLIYLFSISLLTELTSILFETPPNIQLILQSGSFSSTYKFALIISLSRLAIEKGQDCGEVYMSKT